MGDDTIYMMLEEQTAESNARVQMAANIVKTLRRLQGEWTDVANGSADSEFEPHAAAIAAAYTSAIPVVTQNLSSAELAAMEIVLCS